jgi:SAM domain (Sterile alpha motif)
MNTKTACLHLYGKPRDVDETASYSRSLLENQINSVECTFYKFPQGPGTNEVNDKNTFDPENSCNRVSSVSSFINPFVCSGTDECTNYLISELGDEKDCIDYASIGKFNEKPVLKEIYSWLETIHLEELYEVLAEAGYDNSDAMVQQMKGPMPITDSDLVNIGVQRPGHRQRILWKLTQAVLGSPKKPSSMLKCCNQVRDGTGGLMTVPFLLQVLTDLNLEAHYNGFIQSGYDDYESLLSQSRSGFEITGAILKNEIGMNKKSTEKFLNRVSKDILVYKLGDIVYDEPKITACEMCLII